MAFEESRQTEPRVISSRWYPVLAVILLAFASCGEPSVDTTADAAPAQVTGVVPGVAGGRPVVVLLDPTGPGDAPSPTDTLMMDQIDVSFAPEILVAQLGQTVMFRNSEQVPHNVRATEVETGMTVFNVATDWREEHHHRFAAVGAYAIACDIHPAMRATVLVVQTPYTAVTGRDGAFAFASVPPGSYILRVWSRDAANRLEMAVEIDGTVGQTLLESSGATGA